MQQAILKPSEVHMGKMTFSEKSVVHSLARVQSLVWCWCSQDNFKKQIKALETNGIDTGLVLLGLGLMLCTIFCQIVPLCRAFRHFLCHFY